MCYPLIFKFMKIGRLSIFQEEVKGFYTSLKAWFGHLHLQKQLHKSIL